MSYDVSCGKTRDNLGEWIPGWCFAFIRWALKNHEGRCPLKVDWFATRGVRTSHPVVIHELREGKRRRSPTTTPLAWSFSREPAAISSDRARCGDRRPMRRRK